MANANIINGTLGRVSFGSFTTPDIITMNAERYSVRETADDIPAVGFDDFSIVDGYTYDDGATGVQSAQIQVSGFWDALKNPMDNPPSLRVGMILRNLRLYLNRDTLLRYHFNALRVLGCDMDTEVKQRVNFSFSGRSCGRYLRPGDVA